MMFWVLVYFLSGFILPFIFVYIDGNTKEKNENIVDVTTFIIVVIISIFLWPIVWPIVFFSELKSKNVQIKRFW